MNTSTIKSLNKTNKNSFNKLKSYYPWLIWFISSSFIFYKYLLQVSPSVMLNELMKTFSLSGASVGNLAAFYFYAYLSMQLPVGMLLDRYSPRKIISLAVLVCALGALIFSQANQFYIAAIGRLLIGLGGAFSAVGAMKLISMWFPARKFALVSGLMMTMAMLGAVGGEAPLSFLVAHYNWRTTILICSFAGLLLAIMVRFLIPEKTTGGIDQVKLPAGNFMRHLIVMIKSKQSWLISLYSGLAFAPISAFAGLWGIPFLMQKYQMTRSLTASLVSLIFIGFACGAPFAGWLSDKICRRKSIMIFGTGFSLIALSIIIYAPVLPKELLVFLLFIFGFFSGFFFVSFAHMREINNPNASGTSIGFINMFNAAMGALAEPLVGKLLDFGWHGQVNGSIRIFTTSNYEHALIALPIGLGIALILQLFITETNCRSM